MSETILDAVDVGAALLRPVPRLPDPPNCLWDSRPLCAWCLEGADELRDAGGELVCGDCDTRVRLPGQG